MASSAITVVVSDLDVLHEFQMREKLCEATVSEYADAINSHAGGWPFSTPCTVYRVKKSLILVDGFHRVAAVRKAQREYVRVEIIDGTHTDALKAALSANVTHGLRRTNGDKRRAVSMALADKSLGKLSDRKLAELCGVSHVFVAAVRGELETVTSSPLAEQEDPAVSVGSDGVARPATKQAALSQRDKIAAAIFAEPGMSDRQIAKIVGCDHKTVGSVRQSIENDEDEADDPGPEPTLQQAVASSGTSDSDYEPFARRPREPKESPPPALGDDEPFNLGERLDHDRSAILEIAGDYLSARQVKHFVTMLRKIVSDLEGNP